MRGIEMRWNKRERHESKQNVRQIEIKLSRLKKEIEYDTKEQCLGHIKIK